MKHWLSIVLGLLAVSHNVAGDVNFIQPEEDRRPCEDVKLSLCKGVEYNQTTFPNILGHTQQSEAEAESAQYAPLARVRCSPYVTLFLCSVYAPICTELPQPIRPCKSLCLNVKYGCEPLMMKFGYQWPERLNCDQFPTGSICVGQNVSESELTTPIPAVRSDDLVRRDGTPRSECPASLKVCRYDYKLKVRVNTTWNFSIPDCGAPCKTAYFTSETERFAALWVGVWAVICTACCAFTVITCLIDLERFKYPEKPIVFLSGCYLVVAIVYLVGFVVGDTVACQRFNTSVASEQQCGLNPSTPAPGGSQSLASYERQSVVVQGTKKESCTIMFMFLYYFQMASSIWYCIICFTWFLSAGLKWVHEAIESHAQYFHLAAWAIPAGKTIAILATGAVDGDPLSGVCFTGLSDTFTLRVFVIIPLCVYLLFGLVFLISGFVSMFRIRTIIKTGGSKTDKLEKLMLRIGIFSVLYTLPAAALIGCYLYENANRESWLASWYSHCAFSSQSANNCIVKVNRNLPDFPVFLIKYFVTLVVGIATSFWICSGKTIASWKTFLCRICCCARPPLTHADIPVSSANQQRIMEEHDDSGVVPILPGNNGKRSLAPEPNAASNCYPPSYSGVVSSRPFSGAARHSDKHMLLRGPLLNEDDKDHTAYV